MASVSSGLVSMLAGERLKVGAPYRRSTSARASVKAIESLGSSILMPISYRQV